MRQLEKFLEDYDKNIELDENQIKVLLSDKKRIMVVAGAGSGKTTTIAAKVKYIVEVKKVKPEEVLIISLTNKAIQELRSIINEKLNINAKIFTFHKLSYDILKSSDMRYKIIEDKAKLIEKLVKENKDTNKVLKHIMKNKKIKEKAKKKIKSKDVLVDLIINHIALLKSLGLERIPNNNIYFNYLENIYIKYNQKMKEQYMLDFDDLISESIKCNINLKYKYIIVDEYQDISQNRLKLLEKVVASTNSKLMVVGDDFQTIFSFAGSNLSQFQLFLKGKDVEMIKIVNTYRNSQEIVDIAGDFVMRDNKLIKKQLKSLKHIKNPIKIYGYKNNFSEVFEKIILEIIEDYGFNKKILVLGRYKNDIYKLESNKFIIKAEKIIYKKYENVEIDFLTIHSSKGLGYDNVILINLDKGINGFPSSIENNEFTMKLLGYKKNEEEERRLLYVAITRTKNRFYAITEKKNESNYVKELLGYNNVVIDYKIK